jgi:hypothetical protein
VIFPTEILPLLRDHLLRLDAESRYDRFNGFLDDSFIECYAARCADDGTVIIAYRVSLFAGSVPLPNYEDLKGRQP